MTALTVVIPTHGRSTLLARTLESLVGCELPPGYCRTIVVENGSRSGAEQTVRQAASKLAVDYLYHPVANKSAALNAVLEHVGEDLLVLTDDDVRFAPQFLVEYASAAGGETSGAFFGGPMGVDYEQEPPGWLKSYLPLSARGWELEEFDGAITQPLFLGCNFAAFACDLRRCGGFDPFLGPGGPSRAGGQDKAIQASLLAAGVRGRYLPEARVWHYVPVERCTPRWLLRRKYCHAVRAGLDFSDNSPRLWGVPRWMWRTALQKGGRAVWGSVWLPREEAFARWHDYYKWLGLIRGVRLTGSAPPQRGVAVRHNRPLTAGSACQDDGPATTDDATQVNEP
jgi:glycosyltransferase involved in cell wall biosynthesis